MIHVPNVYPCHFTSKSARFAYIAGGEESLRGFDYRGRRRGRFHCERASFSLAEDLRCHRGNGGEGATFIIAKIPMIE